MVRGVLRPAVEEPVRELLEALVAEIGAAQHEERRHGPRRERADGQRRRHQNGLVEEGALEDRPHDRQLAVGPEPGHLLGVEREVVAEHARGLPRRGLRVTTRLRLRGVELVGMSDGIATGRQGAKMHLAVKGLVNELYLDDLRDKTHRGLSGSVFRGLSAGGRIFGYRTVPVPREAKPNDRGAPARFEVEAGEAAIVREIFHAYAHRRSMKAIAQDLNQRRIAFRAKNTKRGPTRLGWAVSTIRVILRNEKYAGVWVWNKTRFLKDPDSGRRRPIRRPPDEWMRQDRPELRIVDPDLWSAVQRRLAFVAEAFGCRPGRPPRGRAAGAYSPYLLSGLLRCALCGARMVGQTFRRRKGPHVYESS
jgi:DNA invertase Pin-like site-specific DNA recombinase